MPKYGLITPVDGEQLEKGLRLAYEACEHPDPLRVLEVGVCHGDTSRGMRDFLRAQGIRFEYTGVDSERDLPIAPPFGADALVTGVALTLGDSMETYRVFRDRPLFHFVFIDGCHCINHVMLDFLHFGDRVTEGGVVVFHDASPLTQNKCDYQGHGPREDPDFGTACREALRKLGLLGQRRTDWRWIEERWQEGHDTGGTAMVQRVACGS